MSEEADEDRGEDAERAECGERSGAESDAYAGEHLGSRCSPDVEGEDAGEDEVEASAEGEEYRGVDDLSRCSPDVLPADAFPKEEAEGECEEADVKEEKKREEDAEASVEALHDMARPVAGQDTGEDEVEAKAESEECRGDTKDEDDLSRSSPDVLPMKEEGEGAGEADEMGAGPSSSSGVPPSSAAYQGLLQAVDAAAWFQGSENERLAMATTRAMEVGVAVDSAAVGAMSKAERAQHEKHICRENVCSM